MKKLLLLIAMTAMMAGCATIICGTSQSVNFSSSPSGAVICDNGMQIGKTPMSAKLSRKDDHAITIKMDGYQPYEIMLKKEFNVWYVGNIVFGGIIGLVIDPLTGAIYKLTPGQVNAELEGGVASSSKKAGNDIFIAVSLKPDAEWERIGELRPI